MTSKIRIAIKEMRAYLDGKPSSARVTRVAVPDVRGIREGMKLTQAAFASKFQIPVTTLREWEYGRRSPDMAAAAYLKVIAKNPKAVAKALAA
ncbi:MAG: helix-turn-helix domain-containing protein [Rhodospirillaceae bacterium]|nr:helix-turn-helix domain-containing protein [Rhodospirillaceae bacterium]